MKVSEKKDKKEKMGLSKMGKEENECKTLFKRKIEP